MIITASELFEFVGASNDQTETQLTMINTLIASIQKELQKQLNRSLESVSLTAYSLREERDFVFMQDYTVISLIGHYRDLYSITALTETGISLTKSTTYNDGKDYYFDSDTGMLTKASGSWDQSPFAITISGKYGYVYQSDDTPRDDVRQLVLEMVASKSGLWKKTFISPDGTVTTDKDKVEKYFFDIVKGHSNIRL
jgi:hypothetical protein